jgi:hypothetical protein
MASRLFALGLAPMVALYWPMCTASIQRTAPADGVQAAQLWGPPPGVGELDTFHGPWGAELAPRPDVKYRFVKPKTSGVNPGMTVRDPEGQEWSVKQAPHDDRASEGPIEVVVSRLLSATGFHQPPVYYLPSFTLVDDFGERTEPGGRFRLDHPDLKERSTWSWQRNPFVGTTPYQGLLVILMLLNSSDLKNSNNSIYEFRPPDGDGQTWYVVRDLGTALGGTGRFQARRGDIDAFERLPFATGVVNGFVEFGDYQGWHQELIRERITPSDVRWACDRLSQLTDRQWRDAFRAGGYAPGLADRYIRRLLAKVAEAEELVLVRGSAFAVEGGFKVRR